MVALAAVCFGHLIMHPEALLVDGDRPSIDRANAGDPRPIGNDLTFVFLPHHLASSKLISAFGHLPLWDARGFGGRPSVGNPQAGLFYPFVWAVWWGPPSAAGLVDLRPSDLGWHGGLSAFAIGVCKSVGGDGGRLRLPGIAIFACTYVRGALSARLGGGLVSLGVLVLGRSRRGRIRGWVILPVVLAFDVPGGSSAGMAAPRSGAIGLERGRCAGSLARRVRAQAGSRLIVWGGALALSLGLAALDLAPQLAVRPWLLRDHDASGRVSVPRHYHLEALNGFQLLCPMALGGPADYFGSDNYWETLLSIGLIPLFLGVRCCALASGPKGGARVAAARGPGTLVRLRATPAAVHGGIFRGARDELVPGAGANALSCQSRRGGAGGSGSADDRESAGRAASVATFCGALRSVHRPGRGDALSDRAGPPVRESFAHGRWRLDGCSRTIGSGLRWGASPVCSSWEAFRLPLLVVRDLPGA